MITDRLKDAVPSSGGDAGVPDRPDPVAAMHSRSTLVEIHSVVREMNAILGASLVAALAGTRNRTIAYRWANPDGPEPANATQTRLFAAYRICRALGAHLSARTVRAWFISPNPALSERTPAEAIADNDLREALGAATAFLHAQGTSGHA
ncbi:hypothetical protein [Microbacterium phyllosphaerae]|uniref:hypothetical protein n=1 Tax=Microbacterium phyllosphaerae TaxID=124798 RepID=UPI003D6551CF